MKKHLRLMILAAAVAVMVPAASLAEIYTVIQSFRAPTGPTVPQGQLIQGSDGYLYGTTIGGGQYGQGTVFRADTAGNLTVLHSFGFPDSASAPYAGLVQGSDGNFYGTTHDGGSSGLGTVFKVDSSGNVTILHSFNLADGTYPWDSLTQGSDGNLYGTTSADGAQGGGTIFKIDYSGNFTKLHDFSVSTDGSFPTAGLLQANDGYFYGTTQFGGLSYGVIFRADTSGNVTVLYEFQNTTDGGLPAGGLIQGSDGSLYGTAAYGAGGYGTVFKIDTGGSFMTLHIFGGSYGCQPTGNLLQKADGSLYGTTYSCGPAGVGTVFKIDSAGNFATVYAFSNSDGADPYAGLVQASDGNLYGTTMRGGPAPTCSAYGCGTIFKVDASDNLTTLLDFVSPGGEYPYAPLIQASDGAFYGTTFLGGVQNVGSVYRMDSGGNISSLHSFIGADGTSPGGGVVQGTDGRLYGTTSGGGASGYGTVFAIDTSGNLTTLHSFFNSDGASPQAGLVEGSDGSFYGTTQTGGASNHGTVFRIDPLGNFSTLYEFAGSDGSQPYSALIQAVDGYFYGTTEYGGTVNSNCATGCGTVFRVDSFGNLVTLHSFQGADGAYPMAPLVQASDGLFYGTTFRGGGSAWEGTVFKMDGSGTLTTLHEFTLSDGAWPEAGLVPANDGTFLGTTTWGNGTIFKVSTTGQLITLHAFGIVPDGSNPVAGLVKASDGYFYGTTADGGTDNVGSVYQLQDCEPIASASGPTTFCQGGSVTLDAGQGYTSYLWSPGGETTEAIVVSTSGSYSVSVTDSTGCQGTSPPTVVTVGQYPTPLITVDHCLFWNTPGLTASTPAHAGDTYAWTITDGSIDSGQGTNAITFTSGPTATLMTLGVTQTTPEGCSASAAGSMQVNFFDVPNYNPFYDFICTIARHAITAGCGGGFFCPANNVLRSQMAVFLLRGEHGPTYVPPPAVGIFTDVLPSNPFAAWIEELYNEQITGGCSTNPLMYCPGNSVSRAGMAVFLLVARHGTGYVPPACTGIFTDVECPGAFTNWIEQLYNEGITGGCNTNPLQYCPSNSVTRAQMAVFLTATFSLP